LTADTEPLPPIRDRLRDLNIKAYYLLVALSFIYGKASEGSWSLKVALSLTAFVAVLPVQDYVKSKHWLEMIRRAKIVGLTLALCFTLYWIS
jgi:hypothetical protein